MPDFPARIAPPTDPPPPEVQKQLRELLARRAREALHHAASNGGKIPAETSRQLRALSFALRTYEKSRDTKRSWVPEVVALGTVAIVVAWLHFSQVREMDIDLRATATHVSFALTDPWELSDRGRAFPVHLISGFTTAWVPPGIILGGGGAARRTMSLEATVIVTGRTARAGELIADPIAIPAAMKVSMRRGEQAATMAIDLSRRALGFQATAFGPVRLSTARDTIITFNSGRAIRISSDSQTTLILKNSKGVAPVFGRSVPVAGLRFDVADVFEARSATSVLPPRSSIVLGTVAFGPGQPVDISDGVSFDSTSGRLIHLVIEDTAARLRFQGKAFGMKDAAGRSLMPSRLGWMLTFERQHLLIGTIGSIVGALMLVLRRVGAA